MLKSKQRGFAAVQLIIAAIVVTVVVGLLWDRHSLKADNKQLTSDLATTKGALDKANDANKSLELDLKFERDLSNASKGQALIHQTEAKAQEKKYAAIEKKLPVPTKKEPGWVASPEAEARSLERITLLWEGFCVDNPDERCTVKEKAE